MRGHREELVKRRHYIKIPATIESYFPGGAPSDWQALAFDDATEAGRKLTALVLPPNEFGPRVALFGDHYYFEAGIDRRRPDTLFLTRIERAKSPNRLPKVVECEIRLLPSGIPPLLDDVTDIFELPAQEIDEPTLSGEATQTTSPNPLLLGLLSQVPQELRVRFRPREATLVGLALGFHQEFLDRSQSLADFLNKTIESCPLRKMSLKTLAGC